MQSHLKLGIAGSSGEWNNVSHIFYSHNVGNQTFKTLAKTSVRDRAISAKVAVPPQGVL